MYFLNPAYHLSSVPGDWSEVSVNRSNSMLYLEVYHPLFCVRPVFPVKERILHTAFMQQKSLQRFDSVAF